jgi:DNA (cytosine-5)-methyltransferase 1
MNNGKAAGSATQQDAECGLLIAHTLRGEGYDSMEDGTGRDTPLVILPPLRSASDSPRAHNKQNGTDREALVPVCFMPTRNFAQDGAFGVRRLMPVECERLQGFPDNYTLVPYRGKPAKDSPRYKAIGNSMAVPYMRWIGERIQIVEGLHG